MMTFFAAYMGEAEVAAWALAGAIICKTMRPSYIYILKIMNRCDMGTI